MESKLTQEEIALKVGRSRPYIANSMRLLQLPAGTQKLVQKGALSAGHARSLLMLTVIKHADDAAAGHYRKRVVCTKCGGAGKARKCRGKA